MKIQIGIESVSIDARGIGNKIMNHRGFWTFAAQTWHRLYSPYVPMRSGTLANDVDTKPGEIVHLVPYARRQYYGDRFNHFGPAKNGKKEQGHPRATARWDEKAAPEQGRRLASTLQAYIDSGRLKL